MNKEDKNTEIKGYVILGKLAKGGMGEVYKALHKGLNKEVILKKLMPKSSATFFDRFKREAQIMMEISHPNVVHIFDYFQHENSSYIAMEYVSGYNLSEIIKKYGQVPVYAACYIGLEVAKGLECAHNKGIIHRDIKPGNVLISTKGEIKLTDFGIAFKTNREDIKDITKSGTLLGTPAYMSPEQIHSPKDVDARTDQYSLGIIMYEMLTGVRPFSNEFNMDNVVNIRKGRCRSIRSYNNNVPFWLVKIVKKLMNPRKSKRYKSISDFIKEITLFLKLKFKNFNELKEKFASFVNGEKDFDIEDFKYSYLIITLSIIRRIFTPPLLLILILYLLNFIFPYYIPKIFFPNNYGFLDIEIKSIDKIDFFQIFLESSNYHKKYKISTENNSYIIKNILLPVNSYKCYLKINEKVIPQSIAIKSYKLNPKNKISFNIIPPEEKEIPLFITVNDINGSILQNYTMFYKPISQQEWIEYKGETLLNNSSYDFYVYKYGYEKSYLNNIYISKWQDRLDLTFTLIEKRAVIKITKPPFDIEILINEMNEYSIDKKGLKKEKLGVIKREREIFLKSGKYNFRFINKKKGINIVIPKIIENKDYLLLFDFNENTNKLRVLIK
ncbi:MAG TPA: serine/threonine-protein kinase [Spirochaetota bacterium]|nr:serine/threonine-protein kinase [Spirochaetota bacterium]HOL56612.1 serine/threonine-protein kinase [Spirochaetota bacterium]HPP04042.1 serine/threonine-protein kinase [Spirochaetota bacterium]